MLPRPKPKRRIIVEDYLLKQRIRRQEQEEDDSDYKETNAKKYGVNYQKLKAEEIDDVEK